MAENKNAELIALEYLLGASETSLQNTLLNRLNQADMRKKQVMEVFEEWATARAEAMLVGWFLDHGAEVMGTAVAKSLKVTEITRLESGSKPGPERAVDIRESLRNLLESA